MSDRIPILVLVRQYTDTLSYFDDWLDAVKKHYGFDAVVRNIQDQESLPAIRREIEQASVILLLHSALGDGCAFVDQLLTAFQARKGLLAVFVGNEVNLPAAPMADKLCFLDAAEADLILTQMLPEGGDWFYSDMTGARVCSMPHALNPDAFRSGPPTAERPLVIGARSHRYGPHMGDSERLDIYYRLQQASDLYGMASDIKIGGERFNRNEWSDFLSRCQATIASEAGSRFLEKDDASMHAIQKELRATSGPRIVLAENSGRRGFLRRTIPRPVKKLLAGMLGKYLVADYNLDATRSDEDLKQIQKKIFTPERAPPVHTKMVSSRNFDAIGTCTVQVMTPGRYNDLLVGDEHYIQIRTDFSDTEQVVEKLRDHEFCQAMARRTREYAMESHTHAHRMIALDREIRALLALRGS